MELLTSGRIDIGFLFSVDTAVGIGTEIVSSKFWFEFYTFFLLNGFIVAGGNCCPDFHLN